MASTTTSSPGHLCVLVHGLWGNPVHLSYLKETLQAQHSEDQLYVFVPKSNADSFTYDGIEVGGERITNEIEQKIRDLEQDGATITKLSLAGYSLGGLVSRYAIGLMYKNGLFNDIEPVNFTTFASPHLGIRAPKRGWKTDFWNVMGSRTLSTSGQQMFTMDNFRETGRPLLAIMADKNSIFMKGLSLFRNKSLYANTQNDRSVPYYTAGISSHDPFVDLEKIDVHYLPGQEEEVILDPANPVTPRTSKKEKANTSESWALISPQTRSAIPFYAIFFSLMPIAIPAFLVNSVYQTYKSTQRVRLHEAGQAGISLGRYRMPLLEEAQAVQDRMYERLAERQGEEYLPTPPPEPASSASSSKSQGSSTQASSKEENPVATRETRKDFPTLALTPEQFEMIEHLDSVGFTKYPAHIQKVRHTHAAIIVRMQREAFSEGKVVIKHWAEHFEV